MIHISGGASILVINILIFCCSASELSLAQSIDDASILLSFKEGLSRNASTALASWNLSLPLSSWEWVQWSMDKRVVELDLSGLGLSGNLTQFWCNLQSLKFLDLSKNNLVGAIHCPFPSSLEHLDLSSNLLTGTLPNNMSSKTLKLMNLGVNNFHGDLSRAFGQLDALEKIDISWSSIHGAIPSDLCSKFPRVSYFSLSSNNDVSGVIPESLANCTSLTRLFLNNNILKGQIPDRLYSLPNLVEVDISHNMLTGGISESISNCTTLQRLDAGYNELRGILPSGLSNLSNLAYFVLQVNQLEGFLPNCLSRKLEILSLASNSFRGEIPSDMLSSSIKFLKLPYNKLSSRIPPWLGNFSRLFFLELHGNDFHGPIPPELGNLMFFKGEGHSTLECCSSVMFGADMLGAHGRQSRGFNQIPAYIDLSNNRLNESIPEELGSLRSLQRLILSNNFLTGPIPNSLGNITSIMYLNLSFNQLSGRIPPQFSMLHFLSSLDVSNNNLTGPIPSSQQLDTLNPVWFHGNPGLCGPPLSVSCPPQNRNNSQEQHEKKQFKLGVPIGVGISFGFWFGLWLSIKLPIPNINQDLWWEYARRKVLPSPKAISSSGNSISSRVGWSHFAEPR